MGIGDARLKVAFQKISYFVLAKVLHDLQLSMMLADRKGGNPKTRINRHTPNAKISQLSNSEPSIVEQ